MTRMSDSLSIIFGVVPDEMSEWNPEIAPHAMGMNANGYTGPGTIGPPPPVNCENAGIWRTGLTTMTPMMRSAGGGGGGRGGRGGAARGVRMRKRVAVGGGVPATGPIGVRAMSASAAPPRRVDAHRMIMSWTAPARQTPPTSQMRPGA